MNSITALPILLMVVEGFGDFGEMGAGPQTLSEEQVLITEVGTEEEERDFLKGKGVKIMIHVGENDEDAMEICEILCSRVKKIETRCGAWVDEEGSDFSAELHLPELMITMEKEKLNPFLYTPTTGKLNRETKKEFYQFISERSKMVVNWRDSLHTPSDDILPGMNHVTVVEKIAYSNEKMVKYIVKRMAKIAKNNPLCIFYLSPGDTASYHVDTLTDDNKNKAGSMNVERFSAKTFETFIGSINEGTIDLHDREEEEDDGFKGKVTHAAPYQFTDEYVEKLPKNFFILFYAPWCTHCTEMKPDFLRLASLLPTHVTLIAMDVSSTDAPALYEVESYPTLYLKMESQPPLLYTGDRTAEDMNEFVILNLRHDDEL